MLYFHPMLHSGFDVADGTDLATVDSRRVGSLLSVLCIAELDDWSAGVFFSEAHFNSFPAIFAVFMLFML